MLHGEGVDALSVALAAASMEERGGELGGLLSAARPAEAARAAAEEAADAAGKAKEKRMTSMPVRKWRGCVACVFTCRPRPINAAAPRYRCCCVAQWQHA